MDEEARRYSRLISEARRESSLVNAIQAYREAERTVTREWVPEIHRMEMESESSGSIAAARAREIAQETAGMLGGQFLGADLNSRFIQFLPYVSFAPRDFLDVMLWARGNLWRGGYQVGTNHLILYPFVRDETELRNTLVHEYLHYASWLGGGCNEYRWEGADGQPGHGNVAWLDEGLTELHAQQIIRGRGYSPTNISYPAETITGFYLQRLAGADTLRRAYLSGDFNEVQRAVDARLGAGTFVRLAGMHGGAEALQYLGERIDGARIDRSAWDREAIVSRARELLPFSIGSLWPF